MIMRSRIQVENILEKHPEARDNDFVLCWLWLQKEYGIALPQLSGEQLEELNGKFSTLTRWRRKIQSDGKYLSTNGGDNRRIGGSCYKSKPKLLKVKIKKPTKVETEINNNKDTWT
tara:strand:- start:546 stop:893 length:348 start_codon:yes stop_codon:yes gene_type:complete